jgi:hypothetical protein
MRRKRNKIHGLNIAPGSWCTDSNMLRNEVVNYFKCLFGILDELRTDQSGGHHNVQTNDDKKTLTHGYKRRSLSNPYEYEILQCSWPRRISNYLF